MLRKQLIRKVISVGICTVIGLAALGFGQAATVSAASKSTAKAEKIISTGKKYLGVKYRFGAPSGVTYAFDCSSFTQYIFKKHGISLPRSSASQATKGKKVSKSQLKKGDLVFFKRPGKSGVGHVAVYIGSGKMLGASGSSVKISSLNSSYWKKNYITARRVL
ncbi:CHAP domain-containing protein [Cohnella sp. CFH 77786]|uniref:C40 family peptidase n=1 Tax=Cohnella sp. CFH 77786 TaxID=2662265 RepID=UPI001C609DC7|nr:C40 family peptidase [Cohnella sp. CFH 77786]MBW5449315.1 CHAP domain-containing protein [Cohnella sp. CFH 77786]